MRNRPIAQWACAMIFFIAAVGCNKGAATPDNPDPEPEPKPVPLPTRIDVSIKGAFNPFVCDDASAPEVCAQWRDGDIVYVIGSADSSKLDTLGILTAKVLAGTGDRTASLTGSMAIPAAGTKISLVCGPALTEAPVIDEQGAVSVSLASQGGSPDSFLFVAYSCFDYTGGKCPDAVTFDLATSLLRINVENLAPDTRVDAAVIAQIETVSRLTLSTDAAPVVTGGFNGTLIRQFTGLHSDDNGKVLFNMAVPKLSDEGKRNLTVSQQKDNYTYPIVGNPVDAGSLVAVNYHVTDLSGNGTANCYVVNDSGQYKFMATVKGNGRNTDGTEAPGIQPESADVLWETFGNETVPSAGDLVSNVQLVRGYVHFTASGQKGNALIAVRDADSTILWSWHIWLTDTPEDQVYRNDAGTMMDRNLGATSGDFLDGIYTYGLMYQWGRKDPFFAASKVVGGTNAASTGTVIESTGPIAVEESVRNPYTFYNINGAWMQPLDKTMWGSVKTLYDPCPVGYRMPDGAAGSSIWKKAGFDTAGTTWNNTVGGRLYKAVLADGGDVFYPTLGYRGIMGTPLHGAGTGFYWSATYVRSFEFTSGNVLNERDYKSGAGFAARCQKEE